MSTLMSTNATLSERIEQLRAEIKVKNIELLNLRQEERRVLFSSPEKGITCTHVKSRNFEDEYWEQIAKMDQPDYCVEMFYDFTYRDPSTPNAEPIQIYVATRDSNFEGPCSGGGYCVVASRVPYSEHTHEGDILSEPESPNNSSLKKAARACTEAPKSHRDLNTAN